MFEFEIRLPLGHGCFTLAPVPAFLRRTQWGQEDEGREWAREEEMEQWQ